LLYFIITNFTTLALIQLGSASKGLNNESGMNEDVQILHT